MTWEDLWSYFTNSPDEIKAHIWKELDLETFLRGLSAKVQTEVLQKAPDDVISLIKDVIYLETQIALGITGKAQLKKPAQMSRTFTKMIRGY